MGNKTIIFLVFCTISISLKAQETVYITENEKDIYWQPNTKINFFHYQAESDTSCIKYNNKYGFQMSSSIGIRGVVDIPNKKKKFDKFYLAPVFCKNCSCILSEDSLGLKVDRLLFDIAELFARNARKELLDLQGKLKSRNIYTMYFTTVKNSWDEKMQSFFASVIREVLIEKKEDAYMEWQNTVDELLQQTELYATQFEDCHRFMFDKPIEQGYKEAKTIVGDLRNKNEK